MNKSKQIGTLFSLLVIAQEGLAAETQSKFTGLHAGFSIGASQMSPKLSSSAVDHYTYQYADLASLTNSVKTNASQYSPIAELYIGYDQLFKSRYMVGFEGFVNLKPLKVKSSNALRYIDVLGFNGVDVFPDEVDIVVANQITIKNPVDVGVDVKLGLLLSPDLLSYLRVGGVLGYFKGSTTSHINYLDTAILVANTSSLTANQNKYRPGVRVGIGVEKLFFKDYSVTMDTAYTCYQSFKYSGSAPSNSPQDAPGNLNTVIAGGLTSSTKISPNDLSVRLGITRHFG